MNGTPNLEKARLRRFGYSDLAHWIARDPDNESYVFRKFDWLSAYNLLSMQSRLMDLERQISEWYAEAKRSQDVDLHLSMENWETFEDKARDPTRPEFRRKELEKKLREHLREYHETLVLQSQVSNLNQPSKRVLDAFKSFLTKPEDLISGRARKMLDEQEDLVALRPPSDTDPLSRFLRDHWLFSSKGPASDGITTYFHERHVKLLVLLISTIVAAILLIGAIVSLYFVKRPASKLGMVACFTTLFAISVGLLTSAKRQEVFAAAAAYAAVLVVFVSGDFDKDQIATASVVTPR